jgi:hypothetical protein
MIRKIDLLLRADVVLLIVSILILPISRPLSAIIAENLGGKMAKNKQNTKQL